METLGNSKIICSICGWSNYKFDDPELGEQFCASCFTTLRVKTCNLCGEENIGVNKCNKCGKALASLSDVSPETVFITTVEAESILIKLEEMGLQIPPMPSKTTIDTYKTKHEKREIWHNKLTYAEKLSFYKNMNKSYPDGCFDPNTFFEVFDKISLKNDYFLDYRYCESDYKGCPAVFARKVSSTSMILAKNEGTEEKSKVLNVIEYENSPSGFFQFALFGMLYDKFYLSSHSLYRDDRPIITKQQCDDLLDKHSDDLRPDALAMLRRLDVRPRVQRTDFDSAHVSMLIFNRFGRCNGFFWKKYTIKQHHFSQSDEEHIANLKTVIQF